SSWKSGDAKFGYSIPDQIGHPPKDGAVTEIGYGGDVTNKYITSYYRTQVMVTDPAAYRNLVLHVIRDDGVVIYVNGVELARSNMPSGKIDYLTFAATVVALDDELNPFTVRASGAALEVGINTIAAELHQSRVTDSDAGFDLQIEAQ